MKNGNYIKFTVMLVASFLLMYAVMFLNVNEPDHIYINMTRLYMTLMMIAVMAVLMLTMMPIMYSDKKRNTLLIISSVLVFSLSFAGVHKQAGIGDVQYMKGMIPHHSIAIMTSQNAHISDPRVRKLADKIIAAQEREIAEMKVLIDSLEQKNR